MDHSPQGPDLLAYALFILLWCGSTSLWASWGVIPPLPPPKPLLEGFGDGQGELAPLGAGTLAAVAHLGAWRAERVAEALWWGLDPTGPRARQKLEELSGIGPVSSEAVLAAYPALVRLLHWRKSNSLGSMIPGRPPHVHAPRLPDSCSPPGPP